MTISAIVSRDFGFGLAKCPPAEPVAYMGLG